MRHARPTGGGGWLQIYWLTTVMLWAAKLTRPRDLARYARNALGRLERQPAEALSALLSAAHFLLGCPTDHLAKL